MPRVSPYQGNFNAGEISPLLTGRVDSDRYKQGLDTCVNMLATLQGPATRRGGTMYIAGVKNSAVKTRLIPFEFSVTQAYVLEFGDLYIRVYTQNGQVSASGAVFEIGSPYSAAQLDDIDYTQSDDTLYLVHPAVAPKKLQRLSNIIWALTDVAFVEGPYGDVNTTSRSLGITGSPPVLGTPMALQSIPEHPNSSGGYGRVFFTVASTATLNNGDYVYINCAHYVGFWHIILQSGTTFSVYTVDGGEGIWISFGSSLGTVSVAVVTSYVLQTSPSQVTACANDGLGNVKVTTAAAHGFQSGDSVYSAVTGYIGTFTATVVDGTHLVLQNCTYAGNSTGFIFFAHFSLQDTGRKVRLQIDQWYSLVVSQYINPAQVYIIREFSVATAAPAVPVPIPVNTYSNVWRMGLYCSANGYPSSVAFHENRLCLAGGPSTPQRIDLSRSGVYTNFAPTEFNGDVNADNAISVTLDSSTVCAISWITSDEHGLPVGTAGGEWILRATALNEALTPANVSAKRITSFGTIGVKPIVAGRSTIYVQRTLRKIRELAYFYQIDGFRSEDLTLLAEHITAGGITGQLAFTKEPQPIVWATRTDGTLIGMTYDRTLDSLKAGWHRHQLGGRSDALGSPPIVESIAVIPSNDGLRDDLWMIVNRYINGATSRTVEVLQKPIEASDAQEDLFYPDCGFTYKHPFVVASVTKANPAVVTVNSHGFSNGDQVKFYTLQGMTQLNGNTYTIAGVTTNTFQLVNTNSTGYGTYTSGGFVRKFVSTISNLTWLANETVSILADGAPQPDAVVSSGGVLTLTYPATCVQIGLNANADVKLLRFDAGSADGTSIGKLRRINEVALMLYRTLGLSIGSSFSALDPIIFRDAGQNVGAAPALFTGIIDVPFEATYDTENQICLRQSQPLPFTLLAVAPQQVTHDQG